MDSEAKYDRPEIIIALVGQAGARLQELSDEIQSYLSRNFDYESVEIKLSKLLECNFNDFEEQPKSEFAEYARIRHLQKMGNKFREKLVDGAALALAGIAEIRNSRSKKTTNPNKPSPSQAYIINQLKHPDEAKLFRSVYGSSFILVGGHEIEAKREENLASRIAKKTNQPSSSRRCKSDALKIIDADEKDGDKFGQNTRDTYPLADFFADLNSPNWKGDIERFLDLLFGHPFHSPLSEEYAMYHAKAISLRSSDERRQVGAVIADILFEESGHSDFPQRIRGLDIVASGMNEVPRRGGTLYQKPDSPDCRDQQESYNNNDPAQSLKIGALQELIEKIREKGWITEESKETEELASELLPQLKGTQFMDIGEFMRQVHAEMSAIIDGAKRGIALHGLTMYVTTFPCHNCTKHIIAAGLQRVVYLEPYPKSRAKFLHDAEIDIHAINGKTIDEGSKVAFLPFSGVAPRQYEQLFSMSARGAKGGLSLKDWEKSKNTLSPRYVTRNASVAYLLSECQVLEKLSVDIYKWDKNILCSKI